MRSACSDLVAHGLAYVALVSPLSTLGIVWQASGGLIASAYLLAVFCMGFTAISYAVMSAHGASAGSAYAFARAHLGPSAGFLLGWMLLLDYLLTPALVFVFDVRGHGGSGSCGRACRLAGFAGGSGHRHQLVRHRGDLAGQQVRGCRAGGVRGRVCWPCVRRRSRRRPAPIVFSLRPFFDPARFEWHTLAGGAGLCLLSFLGFDAISTLSEEVRAGDRRLVGRATLLVLLVSGLSFVMMAWLLGNAMPHVAVKSELTAAFDLGEQLIGPAALLPMVLVMVFVAGFANALPMQASVARVLFAMGRDGQLPVALAQVHPQTGTPHVALLVSGAASFVIAFVMLDRAELLTATVCFGALAAFALLHVAVWVCMAWRGRSRRVGLHWIVPIVGCALCLAVLMALPPMAQMVGLAWLVVGIAAALWRRPSSSA